MGHEIPRPGTGSCGAVGRVLAWDTQSPGFKPQDSIKPDMTPHTCNPSIWEKETGGSEVGYRVKKRKDGRRAGR